MANFKPRKTSPRPQDAQEEAQATKTEPADNLQRLQKVLAQAGFASRRKCEELIESKRVTVDGKVVTKLGTKVDPTTQEIAVDGERVKLEVKVYWLLNKPPGIITSSFDDHGRATVIDLLPDLGKRVYSVGRLDEDSTGLLLITNDGELAHRLTHPRYQVPKTYETLVAGRVGDQELQRLRRGVHLAEGFAKPKSIKRICYHGDSTEIEIVLGEGRNREVRRLFAKMGHKVMRLSRVAIGDVKLRRLAVGQARPATPDEIKMLRTAAFAQPVKRIRTASEMPRGKRRVGKPDPKLVNQFSQNRRPASRLGDDTGRRTGPRSMSRPTRPGSSAGPRSARPIGPSSSASSRTGRPSSGRPTGVGGARPGGRTMGGPARSGNRAKFNSARRPRRGT